MISDYLSAALLIFFAEMGDKTQFLAMAFATKYPVKKILIGVAIGSFLNHGLAMILGKGLLAVLDPPMINFVAGLMFIFFAFQSLKIEDEAFEDKKTKYGPVITVALGFFIGELGDKTQLAALGLAVDSQFLIFSLLGTVTGMLLTSSVGIFVGLKLGHKIPEDKLKGSAFLIFMIFGIEKLQTSYLNQFHISLTLSVILMLIFLSVIAYKRFKTAYALSLQTGFKIQAQALKETKAKVEHQVSLLCKGQASCGICHGNGCLVGRMKALLKSSHEITENEIKDLELLKNKNFHEEEAKSLLEALVSYYDKFPQEFNNHLLFKEIRKSAEMIVFKRFLDEISYEKYKETFDILLKNK